MASKMKRRLALLALIAGLLRGGRDCIRNDSQRRRDLRLLPKAGGPHEVDARPVACSLRL